MRTPTVEEIADKGFDLTYVGPLSMLVERCYMLRHVDHEDTDFTVRAASDGRCLGWGLTKDEAEMSTEINLSQTARGL